MAKKLEDSERAHNGNPDTVDHGHGRPRHSKRDNGKFSPRPSPLTETTDEMRGLWPEAKS